MSFSRLEETVQTLLPLRHQQTALIQSYEVKLQHKSLLLLLRSVLFNGRITGAVCPIINFVPHETDHYSSTTPIKNKQQQQKWGPTFCCFDVIILEKKIKSKVKWSSRDRRGGRWGSFGRYCRLQALSQQRLVEREKK